MLELLPFSPTWVLVGLCVVLLYTYLVWPYSFFTKLGIPGPKPTMLFGSYLSYGKGVNIFDQECYQKYNKVYGFFEGRLPIMMIGDLDIVKEITIKDASNFVNRRVLDGQGEIFSSNLTCLKDGDWKRVRSALTPAFSTGKLKQMMAHIERCSDVLVSHLAENEKTAAVFDLKKLAGGYTMDVISGTAFGVDVDSMNNPNHPLVKSANAFFEFSFFAPFIIILFLFPQLAGFLERLGVSLLPKKSIQYFSEAIDHAVSLKQANTNGAKPADLLQLMLAAHNEELDKKGAGDMVKTGMSKKEIKGNAIIFWIAGYETTSNTLSLTAYNLAVHPEVQDKAMQEIDAIIEKRGKLDYEAVNELHFLEMCINETLRLYPAAHRFDRVCKEDTEVKGLHIPAGTVINVPVYSIHHDADIWPEPEKFKPERFSKEEKEAQHPCAFLPFGSGPRNCVGMRLALLELKFALAKALEKFRFVTCDKTEIPVRLKNTLGNQIEGGIWLRVESRT